MKRIAMFIVMLAVMALGATALQVSAPTLGSANQDRNTPITAQFTVTNDGTSPLTGITIQVLGNTGYNLSAPTTLSDIPAGQSATVTLSGTIPITHNAVDPSTLVEQAFPVGTITVTGNNGSVTQKVVNVSAQAKNQLELKRVRVQCDTTSKSLDDGDSIKNLKPGEDCTLEVEVENLFGDDENAAKTSGIEFSTIDIRVESASNDIDVDDDNDDIEDLDAGDEDSLTFDLNIEDDADARTVSVEIRVKATDENGAVHGEEQTIRMEIERVTHDIQIERLEVSPSRVTNCDAGNVKLSVGVLNLGKRNEDDAAVEVSVPDFKFVKKSLPLELDKDDETTVNFDIPVPANHKAGIVRVDVQTLFDTVAPSNQASVDLTVEACDGEEAAPVVVAKPTTSTTSTSQPTTVPSTTVVVPSTSGAQAATKKMESFTDSTAYVALLVVASVVIVLVLVGMIVMLVRRRQP